MLKQAMWTLMALTAPLALAGCFSGGGGGGGASGGGALGAACDSFGDCASGVCINLGAQSICSAECSAATPCANGYACTSTNGPDVCTPTPSGPAPTSDMGAGAGGAGGGADLASQCATAIDRLDACFELTDAERQEFSQSCRATEDPSQVRVIECVVAAPDCDRILTCFDGPPMECMPDCAGAVCGDDGCGGQCGRCGENEDCQDGACVCVPDCAQRECGDDGCGGSCGECPTDAHACGGSGNVRECQLAAAGEYRSGRFAMTIRPAGCSTDVVVTVSDDGVVRFDDRSSIRCQGEYQRQPLAVNLNFLGGAPRIQAPANIVAEVEVRVEWAGRGSGFTAGFEGAFDVASRRFEGRVTGLPQSAMVNGESFQVSGMTITAPSP